MTSEIMGRGTAAVFPQCSPIRYPGGDYSESEDVFFTALTSFGPFRNLDDIMEQVDYTIQGSEPAYLQSWRKNFRGQWKRGDSVQLQRDGSPEVLSTANPFVIRLDCLLATAMLRDGEDV